MNKCDHEFEPICFAPDDTVLNQLCIKCGIITSLNGGYPPVFKLIDNFIPNVKL